MGLSFFPLADVLFHSQAEPRESHGTTLYRSPPQSLFSFSLPTYRFLFLSGLWRNSGGMCHSFPSISTGRGQDWKRVRGKRTRILEAWSSFCWRNGGISQGAWAHNREGNRERHGKIQICGSIREIGVIRWSQSGCFNQTKNSGSSQQKQQCTVTACRRLLWVLKVCLRTA